MPISATKPKSLLIAILGAIVLLFSFVTYERNSLWGDEIAFLRDCVEKSPLETRAHNNLASALEKHVRIQEAIDIFYEAIRVNSKNATAHYNLAYIFEKKWQLKKAAWHYKVALRIKPDFHKARQRLTKLQRMIDAQNFKRRRKASATLPAVSP